MLKRSLAFIPLLISTSINASFLSAKYGLTSLNNDGISFNNNSFLIDLSSNKEYLIYPRVGLSYVSVDESGESVTGLLQGNIEGMYDLQIGSDVKPFIFGGVGYENVINSRKNFDSQFFIDGGIGAKYPIDNTLNFVTELKSLYMLGGGKDQQSELALYLGIEFDISKDLYPDQPISYEEVNIPDTNPSPISIQEPEVISETQKEEIVKAPKIEKVPKMIVVTDSDHDGIEDRLDKCPNTPPNRSVNSSGCPISKSITINFSPNSSKVPFEEKPKLSAFADYAKRYKHSKIKIVGYSDNSGTFEQNKEISRKRANSVKSLLIQYGISPSRIVAIGKGELNPIAPNDTPEGRAKNRRVEIEIR